MSRDAAQVVGCQPLKIQNEACSRLAAISLHRLPYKVQPRARIVSGGGNDAVSTNSLFAVSLAYEEQTKGSYNKSYQRAPTVPSELLAH